MHSTVSPASRLHSRAVVQGGPTPYWVYCAVVGCAALFCCSTHHPTAASSPPPPHLALPSPWCVLPRSCVYIAPLEALAKERFADWSARFGKSLGLNVVQLTGEAQADVKLLEKVGGAGGGGQRGLLGCVSGDAGACCAVLGWLLVRVTALQGSSLPWRPVLCFSHPALTMRFPCSPSLCTPAPACGAGQHHHCHARALGHAVASLEAAQGVPGRAAVHC